MGGHKVGPREGRGSNRVFLLDEKELQELESKFEDDHNEVSYSGVQLLWILRRTSVLKVCSEILMSLLRENRV